MAYETKNISIACKLCGIIIDLDVLIGKNEDNFINLNNGAILRMFKNANNFYILCAKCASMQLTNKE